MKFEHRARIQGTVDEVEKAMLDERYLDFLLLHHGVLLEAKKVEIREDGQKVHRKIRYKPKPVIKAIGPREVPPEYFAFIENSVYDKTRHELTFTNVPTSGAINKMVVNSGVLKLKDAGGGQTERIMEGEITLKLPFFLKPVAMIGERIIQSEGLKILDAEAPVLNKFIAEVLRRPAS